MPGGETWRVGDNQVVSAAVGEAVGGGWLREVESGGEGGRDLPRIVAPGLPYGVFGGWAAAAAAAYEVGKEKEEEEEEQQVTADNGKEEEIRTASTSTSASTADTTTIPTKKKMPLEDLFAGVWMLEEEEEDDGGKRQLPRLEDLDAPANDGDNVEKVEEKEVEKQRKKAERNDSPSWLSDLLLFSPQDGLGALPDVLDLPGGVTSSAYDENLPTFGWLASHANATTTTLFREQEKGKRSGGDGERKTWAVRGAVSHLEPQWAQLSPTLAKQYPFALDTFQKEAIIHMESGHSVFVAAHTSAGKTVAAEYAFALAAKHCTRAIYTSPIKTISNQKFRDFSGQFDVGLLTGDVSIKPESSCLIMTTEILRSMLYKGADIIRDIEWVIFDEVHYVNDVERGVVWEEVIIMLPDHVNLVLLSATVPNVMEFADWVGRTKRKIVYVTGTMKRPVPLEHSLYYGGKLYRVCSGEVFDPRGFRKAREAGRGGGGVKTKAEMKAALPTGRGGMGRGGGGGGRGGGGGGGRSFALSSKQQQQQQRVLATAQSSSSQPQPQQIQLRGERSQWMDLIQLLKKQDLLPMVSFVFSKKRCDAIADALSSLDLTTGAEKSEIHIFCDRAFSRLKGTDRELPQVCRVREMLKRGVGVHHAGLLPIVKEVVEMLFCKGVIKVLFSTETFAMGVNAPARTVVFQNLRKHDGVSFRGLLPGEYTQMAGRAGRRGLDTVGTVIIAVFTDDLPDENDVRRLLTGTAMKLESQFRLTYSMILNLLRVEDLKVEDMLKRSFAEFHSQRAAPEVQQALLKGQQALRRLRSRPWPLSPLGTTREQMDEYAELAAMAAELGNVVQEAMMESRGAAAALVPGRLVLLTKKESGVTELGVVIDSATSSSTSSSSSEKIILSLVRPSPLDNHNTTTAATAATTTSDDSSSLVESTTPDEVLGGMKLVKSNTGDGDDDDLLMMGGGVGGGKKGKGKKTSSGGGASSGGLLQQRKTKECIPLPHRGSIHNQTTHFMVSRHPVTDIAAILKKKVRIDVDGIVTGDVICITSVVNELAQISEQQGEEEWMDAVTDLKVNSIEVASAARERARILATLTTLPPHRDPMLPEMLAVVSSEHLLVRRLSALAQQSGDAGLAQLPEFHQRVVVLQEMGYLDADRAVTMKGRVACEINSGDELVATELIFGGLLTDLAPEEAVSVLSALVFQEKSEIEPYLPSRLEEVKDMAAALALAAGATQKDCGLDIVPEDYVKSTLNFGLMEVVYEWAKGTPFASLCPLTDVMEGSIVRAIVRLDETCREFRDAARVMGNTALFQQMEEASAAIKRDIVFAASLYVT